MPQHFVRGHAMDLPSLLIDDELVVHDADARSLHHLSPAADPRLASLRR